MKRLTVGWLTGLMVLGLLSAPVAGWAKKVKKDDDAQAAKAKAERDAKAAALEAAKAKELAEVQVQLMARKLIRQIEPGLPPVEEAPDGETTPPKSGTKGDLPLPAVTKPTMGDNEVRFLMNDSAVLTGKLAVSAITVETEYGPLTIPIKNITSFTPGLNSQSKLKAKVSDLVAKLGDSAFPVRQKAQAQLLGLGPRIRPALATFADDKDAERQNRIKTILKAFDDQINEMEEDGDEGAQENFMRVDDVIRTTSFTVWGKITNQTFKLDSRYGPLQIDLADIRRGERDLGEDSEISRKIKVAGSNQTYGSWVNTGVTLRRGDRVSLTASGQITMTPWGMGRISTPDGDPNCGSFNNFVVGTLVGRIGSSGKWFKVGTRHSFTAQKGGRLELAMAIQSNWRNNHFPGQYNVKMKVARAGSAE